MHFAHQFQLTAALTALFSAQAALAQNDPIVRANEGTRVVAGQSIAARYISFDAPGAGTGTNQGTIVSSVNLAGVLTGYYDDANGLSHGFLRSPKGEFKTFEVPGSGCYGTFPIDLNLEGAVVGYYTDPNYLFHAFLRSPDGKFRTFVGPGSCDTGTSTGCYGSAAFNINVFGTIAASYEDNSGNFVGRGLLRDLNGELRPFDVPGAGTGSYQGTGCPGCALGLNHSGAIAGNFTDANNVHHGFLRGSGGKFRTFDAPGAGTGSYQGTGCFSDCPVSLNDSGAITGIYIDDNNVSHGFLRSPEGEFTRVDAPGSVGTFFVNINNSGTITGFYIDANNVYHGFLKPLHSGIITFEVPGADTRMTSTALTLRASTTWESSRDITRTPTL
jgi:hypothetical protein